MGERRADLSRPAQTGALDPAGGPTSALAPSSGAAKAPLPERSRQRGAVSRRSVSRRRVWAARIVALAADGLQFALLPLVLGGAASPVDDAIDVVTAAVLTALVGFRWAFLPAFIAELVPFADMVPSWTIAVFASTRDGGDQR